MKIIEIKKRLGVAFLAAVVSFGTVSVPMRALCAEQNEAAAEGNTAAEEPAPEQEPAPEPEPEPIPEPEPDPVKEEEPEAEPEPEPEPEPAKEEEPEEVAEAEPAPGPEAETEEEEEAEESSTKETPAHEEEEEKTETVKEEAHLAEEEQKDDGAEARKAAAEETEETEKKNEETKIAEDDRPDGEKEADEHTGTNEELIAAQTIISIPDIETDFRFYSSDAQEFMSGRSFYVYEEKNTEAKKVGAVGNKCPFFVLEDDDEWAYIEAGNVRGFARMDDFFPEEEAEEEAPSEDKADADVNSEGQEDGTDTAESDGREEKAGISREAAEERLRKKLARDEERFFGMPSKDGIEDDALREQESNITVPAEVLAEAAVHVDAAPAVVKAEDPSQGSNEQTAPAKKAKEDKTSGSEAEDGEAVPLVPWYENEAFTYTRATAQDLVIDRECVVAVMDAAILEDKDADSRAVGSLYKGAAAYIIENEQGWLFVESGDVRGFVKRSEVDYIGKISESDSAEYALAEQLVEPEDNNALYYSVKSVKEGAKENPERKAIVELALKSVGHPYVWGGTDLYNGADCSGFVQTLYRHFGYNLPRVACDQANYGTKIPVNEAKPGDLIFFAKNGYVYHVAMSLGDGNTVEAYSTRSGIITHSVGGRSAVWATRILQ